MESFTVRQLRRRWKPTKERLQGDKASESLVIRVHRAFSWLDRAEQLDDQQHDDRLVFQWIALNSLFGRWNQEQREPSPDRQALYQFLDSMLSLDSDGMLGNVLTEHKKLVYSILDDEYLSQYFWEQPGDQRARQSKSVRHKAKTWYIENRFGLILQRTFERVYLLRCQLTHGAATYGGRLNRTPLRRCSVFLQHTLTAIMLIIIDRGETHDFGPMCYPPLA